MDIPYVVRLYKSSANYSWLYRQSTVSRYYIFTDFSKIILSYTGNLLYQGIIAFSQISGLEYHKSNYSQEKYSHGTAKLGSCSIVYLCSDHIRQSFIYSMYKCMRLTIKLCISSLERYFINYYYVICGTIYIGFNHSHLSFT